MVAYSVLADADGSVWTTLVTSANAHDASSAHSNVALFVRGEFACQVYEAEAAVARLSGATPPFSELPDLEAFDQTGALHVSYLTESAIRDRLLAVIDGAQAGDEIDVAVFYLSHRRILRSLARAADRGARVRVVLDPNRDAFGRTKNGIPNRQSAEYLVRESDSAIEVRWVDTQGEQYHTKLLVTRSSDGIDLVLGSANFTRRNLDDLNLEANIWVQAPRGSSLDSDLEGYFDRIWSNLDGTHTAEFDTYRDPSLLRRAVARIQERTGLGTF
jgi:phosphatidylserine/phosphatidylglycerophosphate/cardiolipin synthase-like enzyme